MAADRSVGGPCVHHRCANCDRLFKSVVHGTDCPDCGSVALCTFDDMEVCR